MRYFVAGHNGMVGSAICAKLAAAGAELVTRSRHELDLTNQFDVKSFFAKEKPDIVVVAAAKVGGILANDTYPADFIQSNLMIAANLIKGAFENGASRLLMLSSSCVYPREAPQPINEQSLMTGPLEPTNDAYAVAKIAAMKMCESYNRQHGTDYRTVMPCNLYGPNDNFDPVNSHVLPGLIRRFHEAEKAGAPEVVVWGSGKPQREFLHVSDMADAALFVLHLSKETWREHVPLRHNHVNIGSGVETSIAELAQLVAKTVGYRGKIVFDPSKPDGTPRKLLDVSLLAKMGWKAAIPLETGINDAYRYFRESVAID